MAARSSFVFMIALGVSVAVTGISFGADPLLELVSSTESEISIQLQIEDLDLTSIDVQQGRFTSVEIDQIGFSNQIGSPRLPVLRSLVDIPFGATGTVVIEDPVYREFVLDAPVVPLQPSRPKTDEPIQPFAYDPAAYASAGDPAGTIATFEEVGYLRGHRLAQLIVEPITYDPSSDTIRLLSSATIRITLTGGDTDATSRAHQRYQSEPFARILQMATVNGGRNRYMPSGEIGYLVISDPSFTWDADLQELLAWKEQRGFHVTHVSTDDTGPTKEAIKAYIQNAYDSWAIPPTFVLLIGDTPDVPHWTGSGTGTPPTDLNYTMLEGTDYLPDIAIGRMSVTNPTHLHNIVSKTLQFERVEWIGNDDWEKHAVFMASEDNYTVSEGTHNYVISNYLDPLGYTSDKLYSHTYNATTQQVRDAFNQGRSQGTYSGHGSETSWADGPVFTQTDVNNLTNTVYPFVQSYACVTGYFPLSECFGETWIRTDNGAVAFWGSSVNSYWTEDDILEKRLYEGFFADVFPEHLVNQTWIGGMTNYAKLRYFDHFGDSGMTRRYFEMYNIMGDPSIDVWTDIPAQANINIPETLMAGLAEFEVSVTGAPYAMVSVRKSDGGNDFMITAWADAIGHVVVSLPEPLTPGVLSVAITAHDIEPYLGTVQVIQPNGPYLILDSCSVDDAIGGDGNGNAGAGETIDLHVMLENVGIDAATGVSATVQSLDPFVLILDGEAAFGEIPAGETVGCLDPFQIEVDGAIPDGHEAAFSLLVISNEGEWTVDLSLPVQAPVLTSGGILIDDSIPDGNGDGGADPDETIYLQLWIGNVGHKDAGELTGVMTCNLPDVQVLDGSGSCLGVPVDAEGLLSAFRLQLLPTCPSPSTVPLTVTLSGANGFQAELVYELSVGAFFDDAESDRGWTLGATDDNASSGRWVRADPVGTTYNGQPCQPEDDHTAAGTICFVTGNGSVGGTAGEADVDGGKTTLLSPVFDLGSALEASIDYYRWYTNDLGNNPGQDTWRVEVTANGVDWVSLENTTASANSWNLYSFNLGDYIDLTGAVQFRFVAEDAGAGSLVEAAVDDFSLTAVREPVTDVSPSEIRETYGLVSCQPNPFNPRTRIVFRVGDASWTRLAVYDVSGRQVRTLVDGKVAAGEQSILFDGFDDAGNPVSSGIYFLRFETGALLQVRQIALLK